ncbi:MAG: coiled-coil domain-containing protein [Eggerthellaceae bacterium]|jgi:peptidoglycan hydrolase CwlO-like protein
MLFNTTRTAVTVFTAAAVALGGIAATAPQSAFADGGDTGAEVSELQQRVEETASAYDEASQKVEQLQKSIDENNASIAKIKKELPQKQQDAAAAMEAMYKMNNQKSGILEMFFNIDSIDDLIKTADYLATIQDKNTDALESLNQSKRELQQKSEQLASDKAQAVKEKEAAKKASDDAIAAREEAQKKAEEEAAKEAAEAKAAAEKAAAKKASSSSSSTAKSSSSAKSSSTKSNTSSSSSKSSSSSSDNTIPSGAVSTGDVDWSVGKSAFVSTWTKRIDNYLAGSPLAGQGSTFATAAWNYGVDPRWSPAIAYTESSLGAACFKPYNAWGWGTSSWGSWEEAINAHVAGLVHGYGSTISVTAAQKYCPPNWQTWYNKTLAQMNSI